MCKTTMIQKLDTLLSLPCLHMNFNNTLCFGEINREDGDVNAQPESDLRVADKIGSPWATTAVHLHNSSSAHQNPRERQGGGLHTSWMLALLDKDFSTCGPCATG